MDLRVLLFEKGKIRKFWGDILLQDNNSSLGNKVTKYLKIGNKCVKTEKVHR